MRKFKIGDRVGSFDWGVGKIIAMTKTWCIFISDIDQTEIALLWTDGVWLQEDADLPVYPCGGVPENWRSNKSHDQ